MITITATVPCTHPPAWAILERKLIDTMNHAVEPFLARYVRADGELIWREGGTGSRDGADDFYESTYNWPLFYLLGGGDHLLKHGQRIWDGITRQLTRAGMVHKEFELGYDQFHQGESYIYFYFLCLADPTNEINRERAQRFAGFYLNEDPDAPNYDAEKKLIRAPHNGSGGPRWGFSNVPEPSYNWGAGMRRYGLPFRDVPGIDHYDDLNDPAKARLMGQTMHERLGQGDVVGNLIVTSLIANAYMMTGGTKYRDWIVEYVDAWCERAAENGGLLPDNVGLSGQIGETLNGKWYGGLYGWSWPHGYYNIGMAATVAGANAYLVTRNAAYLELPRGQWDRIWALGKYADTRTLEMSLGPHWEGRLGNAENNYQAFVAPYRYADRIEGDEPGWFDFQPLSPVYPVAIWNLSMDEADWQRIEQLRKRETYDWCELVPFRNKEDGGHDQPWLRYLAGENPNYPDEMLRMSYGLVCRRLALIAQDEADLMQINIHHWQEHNPVVTEALLQLTLGAPQIIYNGGLLYCRVRYFDADRQRPGLPNDVAALVEKLESDRIVIHLINLSPFATRTLIIQAGGFGEHRFVTAQYNRRTSEYPGSHKEYVAPQLTVDVQTVPVDDKFLQVKLLPATEIRLDLTMERYINQPVYS
ncbi:hypothetical protein KFU94_55000 [Chloroflexi bacterium TSY]|nr:hypothetical protein [Chloroflexi bacterium TSY]